MGSSHEQRVTVRCGVSGGDGVSTRKGTMAKRRATDGATNAKSSNNGECSTRGARVGNRERIVVASLQLFNELGTHTVSTNHIAAHLSISPGNLYYHFANREEIIRAIFPRAAEAVRGALPVSADRPVSAADVGVTNRSRLAWATYSATGIMQ